MQSYLDLLRELLDDGSLRRDRTGTGTKASFGRRLVFDLQKGLPLITTKQIHVRSMVYELLWFLQGSSNVGFLQKHGVSIWDEWADEQGDLGPVYGVQWRSWGTQDGRSIDQLSEVLKQMRLNPHSRRLLVSAWNVGALDAMALAPCHVLFQFYVNEGTLSCQLYQRSADAFLGLPFNIASYALLTHMIAHVLHMRVGAFIHVLGDVHLYLNHLKQAQLQLKRQPKALPSLSLSDDVKDVFSFSFKDICFSNYAPYPAIQAPVSV